MKICAVAALVYLLIVDPIGMVPLPKFSYALVVIGAAVAFSFDLWTSSLKQPVSPEKKAK